MNKETHVTRCLDYLRNYGSITTLEAIRDLGNTRLSASICTLRKLGHDITSVPTQVPTRFLNPDGSQKTTTISKYTYPCLKIK